MFQSPNLRLKAALGVLVFLIFAGSIGYMLLEKWSFLDACWMTVVSLTTVGYGDIIPHSTGGRIFTIVLIIVGASAVAYALSLILSSIVEIQVNRILGRSDIKQKISELKNHIIVCGAGRVGTNVIDVLMKENVPFCLIEENEEIVNSLLNQGLLALQGDATKDELLIQAGIQHARGVISALSEDAYNVYVTLTAKAINPGLTVVARAERPESVEKLKRAGADKVIAPAQIGGQRMAAAILKPVSVDLVDTLFTSRSIQVQIEELIVRNDSPICGRELRDVFSRDDHNVIVVAIIRGEEVIINPMAREIIHPEDVLVVIGGRQDLEKLEKMTPS